MPNYQLCHAISEDLRIILRVLNISISRTADAVALRNSLKKL